MCRAARSQKPDDCAHSQPRQGGEPSGTGVLRAGSMKPFWHTRQRGLTTPAQRRRFSSTLFSDVPGRKDWGKAAHTACIRQGSALQLPAWRNKLYPPLKVITITFGRSKSLRRG